MEEKECQQQDTVLDTLSALHSPPVTEKGDRERARQGREGREGGRHAHSNEDGVMITIFCEPIVHRIT